MCECTFSMVEDFSYFQFFQVFNITVTSASFSLVSKVIIIKNGAKTKIGAQVLSLSANSAFPNFHSVFQTLKSSPPLPLSDLSLLSIHSHVLLLSLFHRLLCCSSSSFFFFFKFCSYLSLGATLSWRAFGSTDGLCFLLGKGKRGVSPLRVKE